MVSESEKRAGLKYRRSPKGREAWRRAKAKYLKSPKGKAMRRRALIKYHNSPKGHAVRKRSVEKYQKSKKGRLALMKTWARRRILKRSATIGDLTAIAAVYERAQWWRQWFNVSVDHIIPLARNGTHEASNLQIIYAFENRRKHASLNYKPTVIFL